MGREKLNCINDTATITVFVDTNTNISYGASNKVDYISVKEYTSATVFTASDDPINEYSVYQKIYSDQIIKYLNTKFFSPIFIIYYLISNLYFSI